MAKSVKDDAAGGGQMIVRIDRYTRMMLTIIAVCLMWLCLRSTAPAVAAAQAAGDDLRAPIQRVQIVSIERPQDGQLWARPLKWDPLPTAGDTGR